MTDKNLTVGTVRGIAIILVVYGHVIQRSMAPWGEDFFMSPAFKAVYAFHMPLFFFISGYLMAFSLQRRGVQEVLMSRCRSILVPFLSWGTLGVITAYVLNIIDGKQVSLMNFPLEMADQLIIHPVIWFLFTLFAAGGLLLCSVSLEKKIGPGAFAVLYVLLLLMPFNEYGCLYYIKWFYPFYLMGYWANRYAWNLNYPAAVTVVLLCLFVFLVYLWNRNDYIYINKMNIQPGQFIPESARLLYRYGVGLLGILIAWRLGALLSGTKVGDLLTLVGVYSLDIYLVQRYLVEGIYPRIVAGTQLKFDFAAPLFFCIWVPAVVCFFIYLCMMVSKLLIRRYNVLNRLLLGVKA